MEDEQQITIEVTAEVTADFSPSAGYLAKLRQARLPVCSPAAVLPAKTSPVAASADDIHPQYSAPPALPAAPNRPSPSVPIPRASCCPRTRQASECSPRPSLAGYKPGRRFRRA